MSASKFVLIATIVVVIAGCSGGSETPPPTPAASSPAPTATVSPPAPPPAAVTPVEPTPYERAEHALGEGRYEDVCTYLVSRGFSPTVCAWVVDTARASRDRSLSTREYESFVRAQHVRRVSGTVVGWYDEAHNEYEVRIGGRTAILVATETSFETTGRFSMWAQQHGATEEELTSGRVVSVPLYREWPLHSAILDVARVRGDAAGPSAVTLLGEVLRGWEEDYCYSTEPDAGGECFVVPATAPGGAAATPISDDRSRQCRRACQPYQTCRSMGLRHSDCDGNISRTCRECRDEGAAP